MANDLTGDYDVVVEFTIPAVNRVLAGMHSGNRLPHSWSLAVDDNPQSSLVARSVVDVSGDAVTDPVLAQAVARAPSSLKGLSARGLPSSSLDPRVVNPGLHRAPALEDRSHLKGVAQLQLAAPTISLPDDSGTLVMLHTPVMARYFPDPSTMSLPEFLHAEIQITFGVDQIARPVATQAGRFIDVNLNLGNVVIIFHSAWSPPPQPPLLTPSQRKVIEKAIRNTMVTSFQPSNVALPTSVKNMQFKTLSPAICVLLNMGDAAGDPGSVNNVFLSGGDDFAFAVSRDLILGKFNSLVNQLRALQLNITSTWADYTVYVDSVTIELQDGQILLTVNGHGHTESVFSDFGYTIRQAFTLNLVDADGNLNGPTLTAQLGLLGDIDLNTDDWVVNLFKDQALGALRQTRNNFLNQVQPSVRDMLSVDPNSTDGNLGVFLKSLMKPPPQKSGAQPQQEIDPQLTYRSFEIKSSGIVLHGSLAVPDWQNAQVAFDLNPSAGTASPEYSALNTWIPGGAIQEYIWSYGGNPRPPDQNTFVSSNAPRLGYAPTNICLTVKGTRISTSGSVVEQPVSGTTCKASSSIPIMGRGGIDAGGGQGGRAGDEGRAGGNQGRPDIALTQFSASGALEILGHTSLWASEGSPAGGSVNLIVHFPDGKSLAHLDFLTRALLESGRTDAATAIICVLAADQLAKVKPTEGIVFADDDRAWAHLLGVKLRPATFVLGTSGNVVWHYQGELTSADLAAALKKYLVAGGVFRPRLLQASVRIGQPPPNFLLEYAPGRELTLRKLVGRPVVLVLWKSTSKPSLETLRQLEKTIGKVGGQGPVVLAINDGEAAELVKKVAAEHRVSAIVVPDPAREISVAYGVNIWPTTIVIDAGGLVRDIRYGRFSVEQVKYPSHAAR